VALEAFEEKWGKQLPVIGQAWLNAWEHVTPFMAFEPDIRRVIYTTNAIEALKPPATKGDQGKGQLPHRGRSKEADLPRDRKRSAQWTRTRGWTKAMLAFKIHFGDRLPD